MKYKGYLFDENGIEDDISKIKEIADIAKKTLLGSYLCSNINGELTVGDVAVRPQGEDIWRGNNAHPYYTTYGIGFYEYFLQ